MAIWKNAWIASVAVTLGLSCGTNRVKMDDDLAAGETGEIVLFDATDEQGVPEAVQPQDLVLDAADPGDMAAEDDADALDICQPNCEGKDCGDDGCGGNCGICAADFGCEQGACKEIICTPGEPEGVCLGPTTYSVCSASGTGFEEVYCTAPLTCYEGQCVDGCEAGKKICKGMSRVQEMVLDDGGCRWVVVKDCTPGICVEGECAPPPCPEGIFDTTYRFVAPTPHMKEVGELVNSFVELSYDPASVLTSLVVEQLIEQLSGSVSDVCVGDLQVAFGDTAASWLLDNSPEMVQDLWLLAQDVVGILSNVAFSAQTAFVEEPDGCHGTINWAGIEVVTNWGGVATWHFSLEDLAATAVPIEMAESTFVVEAATPQKLVMPSYSMSLDFGSVALLVLNEVLLTSVSELDDFKMLLLSVVDCQAIVAALPSDVLACSGIESWELQAMCTTATDIMLESCMQAISNLENPSAIEVQGTCLQVDNDADGQADELSGGVLTGTVASGWQTGAAVQGQFEGSML